MKLILKIATGIFLIFCIAAFYFFYNTDFSGKIISPLADKIFEKNKYADLTFEALKNRQFSQGEIKLERKIKEGKGFSQYVFSYLSDNKKITGIANIPSGSSKYPVIILLRGWVEKEVYYPGLGTEKNADFFAENGYLTLAPDFLGYAGSDDEDSDILIARFYRPVEVLSLISAISSLPSADSNKIGLWGHSNGGQIALTILEVTGKAYPTSFWAPVSLGFPESVLTYLGTEEEVGNIVKEKIDEFSLENDPKKYSIAEYFSAVNAPTIFHQGTADTLIKTEWTKSLSDLFISRGLESSLFLYKGENHNFNYYKTTGKILRQRDLEFYNKHLKN